MTRPPEYEQVAQWLRAISNDPEFLRELASGYGDIKYAIENGLTRDRYIGERRQFLAERGRRALRGIDLDGKSTAQVAAEYHAAQIAACAHRVRDLEERIRMLETGDFAVPAWCAQDAARDGISLAEAIERYRQDEICAATKAFDHLDEYAVADHEIQAYWAGAASRPVMTVLMMAGRQVLWCGPRSLPREARARPPAAAGRRRTRAWTSRTQRHQVFQSALPHRAGQSANLAGRPPGEHRDAASRDLAVGRDQRGRGLASARYRTADHRGPDRELRGVPQQTRPSAAAIPSRGHDQAGDWREPCSARKERNERCILISQCL